MADTEQVVAPVEEVPAEETAAVEAAPAEDAEAAPPAEEAS